MKATAPLPSNPTATATTGIQLTGCWTEAGTGAGCRAAGAGAGPGAGFGGGSVAGARNDAPGPRASLSLDTTAAQEGGETGRHSAQKHERNRRRTMATTRRRREEERLVPLPGVLASAMSDPWQLTIMRSFGLPLTLALLEVRRSIASFCESWPALAFDGDTPRFPACASAAAASRSVSPQSPSVPASALHSCTPWYRARGVSCARPEAERAALRASPPGPACARAAQSGGLRRPPSRPRPGPASLGRQASARRAASCTRACPPARALRCSTRSLPLPSHLPSLPGTPSAPSSCLPSGPPSGAMCMKLTACARASAARSAAARGSSGFGFPPPPVVFAWTGDAGCERCEPAAGVPPALGPALGGPEPSTWPCFLDEKQLPIFRSVVRACTRLYGRVAGVGVGCLGACRAVGLSGCRCR